MRRVRCRSPLRGGAGAGARRDRGRRGSRPTLIPPPPGFLLASRGVRWRLSPSPAQEGWRGVRTRSPSPRREASSGARASARRYTRHDVRRSNERGAGRISGRRAGKQGGAHLRIPCAAAPVTGAPSRTCEPLAPVNPGTRSPFAGLHGPQTSVFP